MLLFVKKLFKFFLFFIVLFFLVVTGILILNRIRINHCVPGATIENLIAGDSHIMWSIDDSYLPKTRNISLNAEGYIYTYAKLNYLFKHKNSVDTVYLGLGYHNLSSYYDDYIFGNLSLMFFHRYLAVLNLDEYLQLFMRNPNNILKMSPIVFREGLASLFDGNCVFLGSFPSKKMTETYDKHKAEKRISSQYFKDDKILPLSSINLKYLRKIIALCRKNEIKLIALNTPVQKEYGKMIPDSYIDAYNTFLHSNNIPVYNFDGIVLPDSCFLPDGDHVNFNGAMKITKYFRGYLEKGLQ